MEKHKVFPLVSGGRGGKEKHILYSVVYKKLYTLTCGSDAQLERAPVLG